MWIKAQLYFCSSRCCWTICLCSVGLGCAGAAGGSQSVLVLYVSPSSAIMLLQYCCTTSKCFLTGRGACHTSCASRVSSGWLWHPRVQADWWQCGGCSTSDMIEHFQSGSCSQSLAMAWLCPLAWVHSPINSEHVQDLVSFLLPCLLLLWEGRKEIEEKKEKATCISCSFPSSRRQLMSPALPQVML